MTGMHRTLRQYMGLFWILLGCGWASFCFGEEDTSFSYTAMPTKITVAFTGVDSEKGWNNIKNWVKKEGKPYPCNMVEVDFKEYLKDVVSHEWYFDEDDVADPTALANLLRVGAMSVKMMTWWKNTLPPLKIYQNISRHHLKDHPDIVDNTYDHVYFPSICQGEATVLCKEQTSKRVLGGLGDQAVDDTWNQIMKRQDCFVDFTGSCPHTFEMHYLTTKSDCDNSGFSSFCLPQSRAKLLAKEGKTWEDILATYYHPFVMYHEYGLHIGEAVEALSECLEIRRDKKEWLYDPFGNILYKCRKSKSHPSIGPHECDETNTCNDCRDGMRCPKGDHYIDSGTETEKRGTHGVIMAVRERTIEKLVQGSPAMRETWLKVKWRINPGLELDTKDPETAANDLIGWVSDRDLRPVGDGVNPLVQVHITGATMKQ